MRPIKFKGKRIDNGEWVEGDFIRNGFDGFSNYVPFGIAVQFGGRASFPIAIDPETLCQFTGLTDCNGTDMWEGDVVNGPTDKQRYEIRFDGLEFYFMHCWLKDYAGKSVRWGLLSRGIEVFNEYKVPLCVIGNRFDNPELMEVCNG